MVNVCNRRCLHDSCSKRPCLNFKGSTRGMYCKPLAWLTTLARGVCMTHARRNPPSTSLAWRGLLQAACCGGHGECNKLCLHDFCAKGPSHNFEGRKPRIYCSLHHEDGTVDLNSARFVHDSCTKASFFNLEGLNKAYCKEHAEDGVVHVCQRRCLYDPCTNVPRHNFEGSKPGVHCKQQSKDGMGDVSSRQCLPNRCMKQPSYNFAGNRAIYCKQHAEDDMIAVRSQWCLHDSWTTSPNFNFVCKKQAYCKKLLRTEWLTSMPAVPSV